MKILSINSSNFGSTGNIMIGISEVARQQGHECYTACPEGKSMHTKELPNHLYIGTRIGRNLHLKFGYYTGLQGYGSIIDTWMFLRKVDKIAPDLIHLHNLHSCYINLPMLFRYIKKHRIRTVWTLHDCWAFTGQCPYFTMVKCGRWKTGCHDCPQCDVYPSSRVDRTGMMWRKKKEWFMGVQDLTIVTPSQWLADLVKESFLKDYSVQVINNGIDLSIFKPTTSDFRTRYNIQDKYMVLGVAFGWGKRKGLDVFTELANHLDNRYQIVLVGTDDKVDAQLPHNIISIHRTNNQTELAEIYTAADVFANPTREENYPTVNMEALACGTPLVTFRTGGSPEILDDSCGSIVDCDDVDAFREAINNICTTDRFLNEDCLMKSHNFDRGCCYQRYINLYDRAKKRE